jgi:hypothetical protein
LRCCFPHLWFPGVKGKRQRQAWEAHVFPLIIAYSSVHWPLNLNLSAFDVNQAL